jgi:hypothetical protein
MIFEKVQKNNLSYFVNGIPHPNLTQPDLNGRFPITLLIPHPKASLSIPSNSSFNFLDIVPVIETLLKASHTKDKFKLREAPLP